MEQKKNRMIQQSPNEADQLLDEWPFLRKNERVDRFESLPREQMHNLFLDLDAKSQSELVFALPEGVRRLYIRLLAPDDAADLIQESPGRDREYLLGLLDDMTRQEARGASCLSRGRGRRSDESAVCSTPSKCIHWRSDNLSEAAIEPRRNHLLRIRPR